MMVDMGKIDHMGLKDAELCEVKNFEFAVKGKIRANIQLLDFKDGRYGSQARLIQVNSMWGSVSSGQLFGTAEDAINDVLKLIVGELLNDPAFKEEMNT